MFAKVFSQIFDSSLAEDYQVRLVFEDFLKLSDINGVVDMTLEAISRRTNVPLEIVRRGVELLEEPDPKSRTKDCEGRRLIRLDEHRDWGWIIVNYGYYRSLASEDQRREKTAIRVRKFRDINSGNALKRTRNDLPSASASACVSSSVLFGGSGNLSKPKLGESVNSHEEGEPKPEVQGFANHAAVKHRLGSLYGRPDNHVWSYAEDCALLEVMRRSEHLKEIQLIERFHRSMENKRFFPQSVARLLAAWGETLDKARVQPAQSVSPAIAKMRREIDKL